MPALQFAPSQPCAPGFRLEVDMTTMADALNDFSAASLQSSHQHLLGVGNAADDVTKIDNKSKQYVVVVQRSQ